MIEIISRAEMERRLSSIDKDTPVISINDVGYQSPVPEAMPNVLRLYFDDITPYLAEHSLCHPYYTEQAKRRGFKPFTDKMAVDTVLFMALMRNTARMHGKPLKMLIHCYAGVSRSVAMGMFYKLCMDTNAEVKGIDYDNPRFNVHVFSKLVKVYDIMKGDL